MNAYVASDIDLVFKELNQQVYDIIEDEVIQLHNDLIDVGERIRQTGNFKNSFSQITKHSNWQWEISNEAPYASILARGRLKVGGRWYGSVGWAKGLTPMLRKAERNIKQKSDRISL